MTTRARDDQGPGRPFRVALLGTGGIAPEHADALGYLALADLVAVCDLVPARARDLAREYRIPSAHSSLDEMLAQTRPDVVHVLTPPSAHAPLAARCLEAGCHVLVEKPLGVSVAECEALAATARRAERVVGVNHSATFAPAFVELVELVRSRRLGRVNHVSVTFSSPATSIPLRDPAQFMFQSPANMLFELGAHAFSLVRRLMGRRLAVRATAEGSTQVAGDKGFIPTWQASLRCERGTAQVVLSVGRGAREVSVTVLGEDAVARADLVRGTVVVHENSPYKIYGELFQSFVNAGASVRGALRPLVARGEKVLRGRPPARSSGFYPAFEAFYESLSAGRRPPEGLEEGIAVVEYCESTAAAALAD